MAITLAQAKVGQSNKIDQTVIELFQRKSEILDAMVFDNAISPQGGSTLAYTYQAEVVPSLAAGRAINSDYTAGEAIREPRTTNLKVFGGAYEIDRVIANTSAKQLDEVTYQSEKKVEATINLFHQMLINGDSSKGEQFDGLSKLLTDTDNEITDGLTVTTIDKETGNKLINLVDDAISRCNRKPDLLITNSKGKLKLQEAARNVGYLTASEDSFGRKANFYDGIKIVDAGKYWDGSKLADIVGDATTTEYYFVCFGQNELVGLSPEGSKLVEVHLPDFTTAGAVKRGDVEAVWGLALKNTKSAAVVRNITL